MGDAVLEGRAMDRTELAFTLRMQMAQCHCGMQRMDLARDIYMDLNINDILKYGAEKAIYRFYAQFGADGEAEGFAEFVRMHTDILETTQQQHPQKADACP